MIRYLLWIDSGAGLTVGTLVLLLNGWLSRLFALPQHLIVAMGIANVAYGLFSFSLARRATRPRALLVLLVTANAAWAVFCFVTAVAVSGYAARLGLAQLTLEGLFVGGLAALEWRNLGALQRSSAGSSR
jgi:hypothetical protein